MIVREKRGGLDEAGVVQHSGRKRAQPQTFSRRTAGFSSSSRVRDVQPDLREHHKTAKSCHVKTFYLGVGRDARGSSRVLQAGVTDQYFERRAEGR